MNFTFHSRRICHLSIATALIFPAIPLLGLDQARIETRVGEAFTAFGVDGEGVIVGILDRGIDWKNNDFRNEDGTTRIKYILDFTSDRVNGVAYSEDQINQALANGTELGHRDAVGHGTTTTSIAAGNGRNSGGTFRGMAPKASIIAVKVTSDGAPAHGNQPAETGFYDVNFVMKGMDFILEKAAELEMPVVMLPNLGSNGGPTDGTSQFSRKIDSIVGPGIAGVAFVNGPGDEGGGLNRAQATVQPGETLSLEVEKGQPGAIIVDLWYPTIGPGEEGLAFTIRDPAGTAHGPFFPLFSESGRDTRSAGGSGAYLYYHNGRDVDFSLSTNNKRQVWIRFTGSTGTYVIEIKRPEGSATPKEFIATLNFSNYAQNPPNAFKTFLVPGNIWDGATAFHNISPTNYVLQKDWVDVNGVPRSDPPSSGAIGDIWAGSSVGPTFDGRYGVDIAAPGEFVMTTYAPHSWWATADFNKNQEGHGLYGKASAVSAAAPMVTGIIALMLQANPDLDQIQIRDILRSTARQDVFTGEVPNNTWGYGKVDAYEAVKAALAMARRDIEASILLVGSQPEIAFASLPGTSYQIEYKNALTDPDWQQLVSGLAATSGETTFLDPSFGDRPRRFYRVVQERD